MTKYLAEFDDDTWKAFKIVCNLQDLKIKEGIVQAVVQFIENAQPEQVRIDFKVVADRQRNLLSIIYEAELRTLLTELVKAKHRKAPKDFTDKLKDRLIAVAKKHPTMSEDLATEVESFFKTL